MRPLDERGAEIIRWHVQGVGHVFVSPGAVHLVKLPRLGSPHVSVEGCQHVPSQKFFAWGSTCIVDRDLSLLARLPRLAEIRMRDRRSYTPRVVDLKAALF